VQRFDRAAVRRALRQRSALASLVLSYGARGRQRAVFPVRSQQCGQLPDAAQLPALDRALRAAEPADTRLELWVLPADRSGRAMWRAALAIAARGTGARSRQARDPVRSA